MRHLCKQQMNPIAVLTMAQVMYAMDQLVEEWLLDLFLYCALMLLFLRG